MVLYTMYSIKIVKGDNCDMYYKIYIDNKVILDCCFYFKEYYGKLVQKFQVVLILLLC